MCWILGADLLRLTREDLIQICGLADGIRLNNALQSKLEIFSFNACLNCIITFRNLKMLLILALYI